MSAVAESNGLGGRIRSAYRHVFLLGTLILVVFVRPFLGTGEGAIGLTDMVLFGLLFVSAALARSSAVSLRLLVAAALATVGCFLAMPADGPSGALYGFLCSYIVFLVLVAVRIVAALLAPDQRVDTDALCGAFAVFLIMGLIWALAFTGIELAHPGTFAFATGPVEGGAYFPRFLGFSFATLTTLGYGNVAPTTPQGDAVAGLEAVVGQFYMAVVIARIVGLHMSHRDDAKRNNSGAC